MGGGQVFKYPSLLGTFLIQTTRVGKRHWGREELGQGMNMLKIHGTKFSTNKSKEERV